MKVVLTGGAGFIGSHVAEGLLRRGDELHIVDNLNDFYAPERKRANLEGIRRVGAYEFHEADICSAADVRGIFERVRPDVCVHLAARAGVRPSIDQPVLYEQVNVGGTVRLLEAAREFRVKKFVFGSSSSVYGESGNVPFRESEVQARPISPYAATKLAGEQMCYTYAHLHGLTAICLRFFTVFGPRQRPDLAIHKFTALMEEGKAIPVFGDGSTGRDYTYVGDIAAGVLAALDYSPVGTPAFEILNLGNSHPVRLSELIEALEAATGKKAVRNAQPPQPGDVSLTWADISKAERLLGYRPRTSLAEGLKAFVEWYRASR
jgi:UDP-glucuronate 4-epimerase